MNTQQKINKLLEEIEQKFYEIKLDCKATLHNHPHENIYRNRYKILKVVQLNVAGHSRLFEIYQVNKDETMYWDNFLERQINFIEKVIN